MTFRWSAAIALWTILSGPIMQSQGPQATPARRPSQVAASSEKVRSHSQVRPESREKRER